MQEAMQGGVVVVLGTGGTIAGAAESATDNVGYAAGQVGVAQLLAGVPGLAGAALEAEQIAQIDSKDMDAATWQALAERAAWHLARPEVDGVVVTHGTDTMEETAYLLQRVLAPAKPLVLTGAMRPSTAVLKDGPQNLMDAVAVSRTPGARGVCVVFAGTVYAADAVCKVHPYRLDAFDAGDGTPIGRVEEGVFRATRPWPHPPVPLGAGVLAKVAAADWPRVELVTSHAGADGVTVDMLLALNTRGFVVAGTGNGSVHHRLEAALRRAQSAGALVLRTTRCTTGRIVGAGADELPSTALTPVQARVELLLSLLAAA
jgi:L-asparaginase